MSSEEAQLEFVIITQQLEGYGDEYYPAKVSLSFVLLLFFYVYELWLRGLDASEARCTGSRKSDKEIV